MFRFHDFFPFFNLVSEERNFIAKNCYQPETLSTLSIPYSDSKLENVGSFLVTFSK